MGRRLSRSRYMSPAAVSTSRSLTRPITGRRSTPLSRVSSASCSMKKKRRARAAPNDAPEYPGRGERPLPGRHAAAQGRRSPRPQGRSAAARAAHGGGRPRPRDPLSRSVEPGPRPGARQRDPGHPHATQDGGVLPASQAVSRRRVRAAHHRARLARRRVRRGPAVSRPFRNRQERVRPRSGRAWPSPGGGRRGAHHPPGQRRPDRPRARDLPALYGDPRCWLDRHQRAVRQQKRIEVVVQLEDWDNTREYDRTGLDQQRTELLDVELPLVTVPLNPGKNLTVICEVVAMNHLLRYSGVDSANAFNERLIRRMREKGGVQHYLEEDYE